MSDWIPAHEDLPRHPKLLRFANRLGVSRHEALGLLIDLWLWCLRYAESGVLTDQDAGDLLDALNWRSPGLAAPTSLLDALVAERWLDRRNGAYAIHNWGRYAGRLMVLRASNRDRQKRHRDKRATSEKATAGPAPLRNGSGGALRNGAQNKTVQDITGHDQDSVLTDGSADAALPGQPDGQVSDAGPPELPNEPAAPGTPPDATNARANGTGLRDHWIGRYAAEANKTGVAIDCLRAVFGPDMRLRKGLVGALVKQYGGEVITYVLGCAGKQIVEPLDYIAKALARQHERAHNGLPTAVRGVDPRTGKEAKWLGQT